MPNTMAACVYLLINYCFK